MTDHRDFDCPICSFSGAARPKYDFGEQTIYTCPVCEFMFLSPQPTAGELRTLYSSETYFQNLEFFNSGNDSFYGYPDYFAERFNRQKHFEKIARRCHTLLKNTCPAHQNRFSLLEIGCGPGFFLDVAQNAGFDVEGIEFNKKVVSKYAGKYNFPIRIADYENENDIDSGMYDCIVLLDVIEHFTDPFKVMRKISRSLRSNGLLVLSTMDSSSFISRLMGKRLEDFRRIREHLFFFNRKNIRTLLGNNNFQVLSIGSVGHSFDLGHLVARLELSFPVVKTLTRTAPFLLRFLKGTSVHVNPLTKMIVYARKSQGTD